jgi:hypothetical protein
MEAELAASYAQSQKESNNHTQHLQQFTTLSEKHKELDSTIFDSSTLNMTR